MDENKKAYSVSHKSIPRIQLKVFQSLTANVRHQEPESPPPYTAGEENQSPLQENPICSPQSDNAQEGTRTLKIDFTGWAQRHIQITEVGPEGSVLYSIDTHLLKPHMVFKRGLTEEVIATVDLPSFRWRIKTCVHGQDITLFMKVKMGLKTGIHQETTFESPALGSTTLTWRSHSYFRLFDFECLDEKSLPLAKCTPTASWNGKQGGQFDLYGTSASSGDAMDELVVTGLALAYYNLIMTGTVP